LKLEFELSDVFKVSGIIDYRPFIVEGKIGKVSPPPPAEGRVDAEVGLMKITLSETEQEYLFWNLATFSGLLASQGLRLASIYEAAAWKASEEVPESRKFSSSSWICVAMGSDDGKTLSSVTGSSVGDHPDTLCFTEQKLWIFNNGKRGNYFYVARLS